MLFYRAEQFKRWKVEGERERERDNKRENTGKERHILLMNEGMCEGDQVIKSPAFSPSIVSRKETKNNKERGLACSSGLDRKPDHLGLQSITTGTTRPNISLSLLVLHNLKQ